jgi:Rrf2 family iron-sulfur cluster assembly transcriptional regulator
MFFLPKKTLIATDAVIYISYKNSPLPISSKEICKHMKVSLRNLEQILQRLVKAGILKGVRGSTGGYLLGRDRRKITMFDIHEAVKTLEKKKFPQRSETLDKILLDIDNSVFNVAKNSMIEFNLQELNNIAQKIDLKTIKKTNSDFTI